ncbi:hypothetical protein KFE25_005767 [Diacronema lutheri]|uniref:Hemerythrin-like domain-containing protein n=1 Tax=Diacronema lutheri TaxID=2081491 RepID=A0A8J5X4R5_DIALT|nr:hypothetical protein KFE25_005767 [Diacronema lutheri]
MASSEAQLVRWRAHPRYARARSWLETHGRLLALLRALCDRSDAADGAARAGDARRVREEELPALRDTLDALELQLDAHSTLEDRKLFPFLHTHFRGAFGGAREQFAREHEALDATLATLADGLAELERLAAPSEAATRNALCERTGAMRDTTAALERAMRAHFAAEEKQCVELMLGMSDAQNDAYAAFRMVPPPPPTRSKL